MRSWFHQVLITARKRRLGQGNVFTCVCHSFHRGKGGLHSGGLPLGRGSASRGLSSPPGTRKADSTHPTGMLSCSQWFHLLYRILTFTEYCTRKTNINRDERVEMSYRHVRVNQKHDSQVGHEILEVLSDRISCQFLTSIQIIWYTESVPFTVSLRFFLLRWQKIY